MTAPAAILLAALAAPAMLLAACAVRSARDRMALLLPLAPLPAFVAALVAATGAPIALAAPVPGFSFALDAAGAWLLLSASLLWIAAGCFAVPQLRRDPRAGRFAVWWLATLTGNVGVFAVADVTGFYLFFSLVSLAAWGMVAHDGTQQAHRAGAVYASLAVLGEAFLLLGLVLLAAAAPDGSHAIRDGVTALAASPWRDATLVLLILGFGLKIGLVPGHPWMPLAYAAAPIPAAAVMSGAAVKAGAIGLVRFLPFASAQPEVGTALAAVGLIGAFYGVAIGVTQRDPRVVLAYSSVSQMGFLAMVLGMGLAAGDPQTAADATFYAAHHVLVKGALFLAIGCVAAGAAFGSPWIAAPAAFLALSLAGLPPTGGALAKYAAKAPLGGGAVALLATLAAAASTALMLHFLALLARAAQPGRRAPVALVAPWVAVAAAAVLVPWVTFRAATGGDWRDVLAPAALAKALWPILLGVALAAVLRRAEGRLPAVPPGDVLAAGGALGRIAVACGAAFERLDGWLREWPVASASLLAIALALGAAMLGAR